MFANPRNAAAGTLKSQNSAVVAARGLDAYLYYLLGENLPADTHYENLQYARSWGFKVSDAVRKLHSVEEVKEYINYWDMERKNLPVATDGMVFKVNSLRQQKNLGYTAKSPRWAIAYKFQAEKALTRLNSVSYQVGRTGTVTPVANLDPVLLSGTIVKRATLHNEDIINALDLHIGDMVFVEKGGEIIPKITAVDTSARLLIGEKVRFIRTCPECGTPLKRIEGEAAWFCPNEKGCPPQIKGRIEHFISRKAMNIEGLGSETIGQFYSLGLVRDASDLYTLQPDVIAGLERMGERSAQNIVDAVKQSCSVPFERVLFALGIRYVGETVAKKLALALHSIDRIIEATTEDLIRICLALICLTNLFAQETVNYKEKMPYKTWVKMAPKLNDEFFKTDEAIRIGDNVLLYQQTTGGWPKNIYMPAELTEQELEDVLASKDEVNESTIDNDATSTETACAPQTAARATPLRHPAWPSAGKCAPASGWGADLGYHSSHVSSDMCGDVVVDVTHGLELCQLLVRDGHTAGILQRHVQLHGIQAVGLQILGQAGLHGHLVLLAVQGVNNDLLHFFKRHGNILL